MRKETKKWFTHHSCYATFSTDVSWHTLKGHDGAGSSFLGDTGLKKDSLVEGHSCTLDLVKRTCSAFTTSMMTPPCKYP